MKKGGSSVQVEVSVEVGENYAKLVRCMWCVKMVNRQQFSPEVIRTVGKGTQHGWSKLVGLVGSHVQEEACARPEVAKGLSAGSENNNGGTKNGQVHALGAEDGLCGKGKFKNDEVDNDVFEVVRVCSESCGFLFSFS